MHHPPLLGAAVSLLATVVLLVQATTAAFTATTANGSSTWSAGTVSLTDDSSSSVMFTETDLVPTNNGRRCIRVTYNGSEPADVRLYASVSGGLSPYVFTTIQRGSGGDFDDCTGFAPSETLYGSAGFGSLTATDFATGLGTFAPTGPGQSTDYRVTWTLINNGAAQGQSMSVDFTWEARNS